MSNTRAIKTLGTAAISLSLVLGVSAPARAADNSQEQARISIQQNITMLPETLTHSLANTGSAVDSQTQARLSIEHKFAHVVSPVQVASVAGQPLAVAKFQDAQYQAVQVLQKSVY